MEKLFKALQMPHDKALHAFWLTFAAWAMVALGLGTLTALTVISAAAVAKEVYDKLHPNHTADLWDWVAGVLPTAVIVAIIYFRGGLL